MANLEDEAAQTEEAVATAAASAEADDVISNTYPAAAAEVASRLAASEVEMREMKAELKDFIEADWMKKRDSIIADHKQRNEELQNLYSGVIERIKEIGFRITTLQIPLRETRSNPAW